MDIEAIKKSINDKFNYLENKVDILALEPITTDNKEQIYGYTVNQLLEKVHELKNEMTYAYIAGFFDGEGSVGAYKSKWGIYLNSRIGNTNLEILVKIKEVFGGYVSTIKKTEGRKQAWSWIVTDKNELRFFFEKILPYSTVKKQQIIYGLKYLELTSRSSSSIKVTQEEQNVRQFISDKIKELKNVELSNEELDMFDEKIKIMSKDKNQLTMEDY